MSGLNFSVLRKRYKVGFLLFILLLLYGLLPIQVSAVEVPVITDIRQEAQQAKEKNLPILVLFSSDHCPFCELVKEDFLKPMLISGDYTERVIIRELNLDEGGDLIDFNGRPVDNDTFTYRYQVSMFPTMVMIDYQGNTLAHRILGVNTPEMFGGRIDKLIELANQELNQSLKKQAFNRH